MGRGGRPQAFAPCLPAPSAGRCVGIERPARRGPRGRGRRSSRAPAARRPPRRPWRRCRCTGPAAARAADSPRRRRPSASAARRRMLAATPPATTRCVAAPAPSRVVGDLHGAPHAVRHAVGHGRLEGGAQVGDVLLAERHQGLRLVAHRGLEAGEGEMRLRPAQHRPRQREAVRPGRARAACSTAGPPGKPRPSSLAVLSKASPSASSMVVPSRW